MSEFKFDCPKCGQHIQCAVHFSGRHIPCPACKVEIVVPPVPGRVMPAMPKSGMTYVPESWRSGSKSKKPSTNP